MVAVQESPGCGPKLAVAPSEELRRLLSPLCISAVRDLDKE